MYYGYPPHIPSPDDRSMIACGRCGWISPEMTMQEKSERGVPLYCDDCGGIATWFATYAPHEKEEALSFLKRRII